MTPHSFFPLPLTFLPPSPFSCPPLPSSSLLSSTLSKTDSFLVFSYSFNQLKRADDPKSLTSTQKFLFIFSPVSVYRTFCPGYHKIKVSQTKYLLRPLTFYQPSSRISHYHCLIFYQFSIIIGFLVITHHV